ncbi:hypothetical protein P691DRAFT_800600 [Macrolepiota fuliginosa MF-IS2]|uniref:DUF6699 domain-containing protein n=1 Tax=Macrolepiota fuliginosa MF-IS2 TaxID=1400762 RepID=A0A9P6C4A1_9AGAR|nr:hypothetical protein P691DRAFT_800600 [Macrolepiota fuliginosa MF-IS2]
MYNAEPPPLVAPGGSPGGDFFSAFPAHQRQYPRMNTHNSPWSPTHEPPPPWVQPPPPSAPPAWFTGNTGFSAPPPGPQWDAPSPFHQQTELDPFDPWSQRPAAPPWSSGIPMRPAESAFGQPIGPGFFGANAGHAPSQNYNPWNAIVRSTSERAAPRHTTPQPAWEPPPHQPWDTVRPKSAGPGGRAHSPFRGPPIHLIPDTWSASNLARRPRDWRPSYNPRASFLSSLSGLPSILKIQSDVQEFTDPTKRRLCQLLEYHPTGPPISHDLRLDPLHPSYPISHSRPGTNPSPFGELEMAQFATTPGANVLRVLHPRLPWYIDVQSTHPNEITVMDVLDQVYNALQTPILPRHFWNEVLSDADRREIGQAYSKRVSLLQGGKEKGILWIDFLCDEVIFEGLVRTKGGLWEIKTRRALY